MAMQRQLEEICSDPTIGNDTILVDLFYQAARRTDWMFYICKDITSLKTEFVNDTAQTLFGMAPSVFAAGGAAMIYQVTHPDSRPHAVSLQTQFVKQSKEPGFDRSSLVLQHFPVQMKTPRGYEPFHIHGVVLTYHDNGDLRFGLALAHPEQMNLSMECEGWLRVVKFRHNEIFQHGPLEVGNFPLNPVFGGKAPENITPREAEVLQLLAQGLATIEVANKLLISHHTVETYRKKLLEKFEAKNTAELIKKASKVFWLE